MAKKVSVVEASLKGLCVDMQQRPNGIRGVVFDTILSAMQSDELLELHEIVEDIMTAVEKDQRNYFQTRLKESKERNTRQHEEDKNKQDQINCLKTELNTAINEIERLRGKQCCEAPSSEPKRATVNVYVDDYEKLQRKVNVLLEAFKQL